MSEPKKCLGCITGSTSSADRYCNHCSHIFATANDEPPENHKLRGGEWVKGPGGVRTWTGARSSTDDLPPMTNDCGTDAGYREHTRKRGEKACKDCLSAHAVAERLRAADRRIRRLREQADQDAERGAA